MTRVFLLALLVGSLVLAINANALVPESEINVPADVVASPADVIGEYGLDDDFSVLARSSFLTGIYKALKISLRTVKGLHCTIQAAVNMRNAAQNAVDEINACGATLNKQTKSVLKSCQDVIKASNAIVTLKVCKTDIENENENAKVSFLCFLRMLWKMNSLKNQISHTVNLIKKVPTAGKDANDCVTAAVTELNRVFTSYPQFVVQCSKLTS